MTNSPTTLIPARAGVPRETQPTGAVADITASEAMQRADMHFGRGEWEPAARLCAEALAREPRLAAGLCMLGVLNAQAGQASAAAELFARLIEVEPSDPIAHSNYANSLLGSGRAEAALQSYARALELESSFAEAHLGRGAALLELKRYPEAIDCFDRALQLKPDFGPAFCNRGKALTEIGRPTDALASYEQALRCQPQNADAWYGRGVALERLWKSDAAIVAYEHALRLRPAYAEAWYGRGNALKDSGRHADALQSYERAIRAKPTYVDAWNNHAQVLRHLNRWSDAIASFGSALRLDADYPWLRGTWLHTRMQLADWDDAQAAIAIALADTERGKRIVPPFAMLALSDSLALQRRTASLFSDDRNGGPEAAAAPAVTRYPSRAERDRLRIAYLSADFRDHAVSYLMAGVLEHHDRRRFNVVAASLRPVAEDGYGRRVAAAVDQFVDLSRSSDVVAAEQLKSLGIDILVDLGGHTQGARMKILAARPAPIQVNYLGFPGTSGCAQIDYLLADRVLIPSEYRGGYSENIVYLPECFQANDHRRARPAQGPPRAELGLPDRALVLCCFNNSYKLTPRIFDLWMRLLRANPDSVLWLAASGDTLCRNLRLETRRRGIAAGRLVFAERLPYEQHLSRLPRADLFLDTLPFNGGTTVSDALWMGVPVLTCVGEALASRMGASLVCALGLDELVCDDLSQYEERARALLAEPDRLAVLRQRLGARLSTSPLFDTVRFTRHLETAFEHMYREQCAGRKPQSFEVPPLN